MQVCKFANILKRILLLSASPLSGKRVSFVTGKATGEIAASGRFIGASHQNLITIVKLRYTARCKQKRICQLETGKRGALLAHKAAVIVATKQCDQNVGISVEIILRQSLWYFVQFLAFGKGMTV